MKFFLRFKIYELTVRAWTQSFTHTTPPYYCHLNPTELVWSQTKRYYNSSIGQYGFGMEAVKKMWEQLLEQVCMLASSVLTIKDRL
jgi:hypothetical protein